MRTTTNRSGGIQGGISNGETIYFRVAFKPVATVMHEQETMDVSLKNTTLKARGRHDPCVLPRAVPMVEAMTALVLADHALRQRPSADESGDMITPNPGGVPKKRLKAARRIAIGLAVYAIVGFFILPPIIRAVAVKQLSKQLDREVTIGKVRLNPFVLSITIRNLLIKDKDGEPFVSWDDVYVNFQLSSFLGHPWVFKEVSTTRPFVRVQMNKDFTLNFSDLITKFSTNAPPKGPSKPLALQSIACASSGATASLTDLTPHSLKRVLGPLNVTLDRFRTDPESRNPYSFSARPTPGTIRVERLFLPGPAPVRGDLSFGNLSLNKYAPLYQDLVRFEIKDGIANFRSTYRIEWSASKQIAAVTNASFSLHSFKLAEPGSAANIVEKLRNSQSLEPALM